VPSARDAAEDVAVGSNILKVFQGDPEQTVVSCTFCVGQIRQIRAAMRAGRKSQTWLSVAGYGASALMFGSPWAAVDSESGRLLCFEDLLNTTALSRWNMNYTIAATKTPTCRQRMWFSPNLK
jgi:hypothetical protein